MDVEGGGNKEMDEDSVVGGGGRWSLLANKERGGCETVGLII